MEYVFKFGIRGYPDRPFPPGIPLWLTDRGAASIVLPVKNKIKILDYPGTSKKWECSNFSRFFKNFQHSPLLQILRNLNSQV